jgi:hypothetical protein
VVQLEDVRNGGEPFQEFADLGSML